MLTNFERMKTEISMQVGYRGFNFRVFTRAKNN